MEMISVQQAEELIFSQVKISGQKKFSMKMPQEGF
jgi:hypothetical protein